MKLSQFTIKARLAAAFGILAIVVLVVSAISLVALGSANSRFAGFVSGISARTEAAAELRGHVDERAIAARNLVLVTKPEDMEVEKANVTKAHANVLATLARLKDLAAKASDMSPRAKGLIDQIEKIEGQYGPVALAIVDLTLKGKKDEAIAAMNDKCRPLLAALVKTTDEYRSFSATVAADMAKVSDDQYLTQRNYLLLTAALSVLIATVAGIAVTSSITKPIEGAVRLAAAVAAGDLTQRIDASGNDEIAKLLSALGHMNLSLGAIVHQVRESSENIASGSSQIATGNSDLSQRTEEQASALQQTAATMEELSSTVKNNADNAKLANQLASGASEMAVKGGGVVNQAVDTMRGINASSKRIADIISVIDGIAFQTNILALNAAVEAARAGEQGRGFAVVASEVRSLAQRSAGAAKEIKSLIEASVVQVELGSRQVDEAGSAMSEIVAAFKRVGDIVAEISAASAEQSMGASQVGEAVSQMDQTTQQNAALVEESAAAAESLRVQAAQLVQAVATFKLQAKA